MAIFIEWDNRWAEVSKEQLIEWANLGKISKNTRVKIGEKIGFAGQINALTFPAPNSRPDANEHMQPNDIEESNHPPIPEHQATPRQFFHHRYLYLAIAGIGAFFLFLLAIFFSFQTGIAPREIPLDIDALEDGSFPKTVITSELDWEKAKEHTEPFCIELNNAIIDKKVISHLSRLSQLRIVILKDCDIDDSGVADLAKVKRLQGVIFSGCKNITANGLVPLAHMKNLRLLGLE